MAPSAYTASEGQAVTFAEFTTKIGTLAGEQRSGFHEVLAAFKAFLTSQEQTKVSK